MSDRNPQPPRGICLSVDRPDDIERSFATLRLGAGDVDIIACSAPATGDLHGRADRGLGGVRNAEETLVVYTAGAGIRPDRVIAVSLDAATGYEAFIERYVQTASKLFPDALLHFQDFGARARGIVQAYRVFDDTTQGTGAVVLAAMYAASRVTGIPMKHQTVVVSGACPAGVAIAGLVHDAIVADGAAGEQARDQILAGRRAGRAGRHDRPDGADSAARRLRRATGVQPGRSSRPCARRPAGR